MQWESIASCPICSRDTFRSIDPEYNLCACECGFVFDNPRPTLESIGKFYSAKGKYQSWIDIEAPYERLWKRRLRILMRYARPGNLLDIGAGIGQFLSLAKPFFQAVSGTELSSSGAEVAAQKYGIELTVGDIHSLSLPAGAFGNITLFHVLEHVHDPVAMLRRCHELLRPNGIIMVCVPNDIHDWKRCLAAWGKRIHLHKFEKFSPVSGLVMAGRSQEIHLSHFTEKTLVRALERTGFTIEALGLDPFYAVSWAQTIPHTLYYQFHRVLYRLTGVNQYCTILALAKRV